MISVINEYFILSTANSLYMTEKTWGFYVVIAYYYVIYPHIYRI